jgi:glycerophosphoryl diester phosphodiesterase
MKTRPLLIGHRGVRGVKAFTENTLAAFDYALAEGCDGFEFDVRMTADGQAVICHDETLTIRRRRLIIADAAAAELDLPSLQEVLRRYQKSAFLDIELKVPGLEETTVDLLRKLPPSRGFVVSSFLPEVLGTLRDLNATLPLGLICETRAQLSRWSELPVDYVFPNYKLVRRDLVWEFKAAGKKTFVWTANLPAQMKRFAEWGVEGIISDQPGRLVHAFTQLLAARKKVKGGNPID